jgi:hypothetical protein
MSDWTDTLDARREGLVEGFHGAGDRIDKLDDSEVPATGAIAPDSDAPAPPAQPVDAPVGGHGPVAKKSAARKSTAKKASSARKR